MLFGCLESLESTLSEADFSWRVTVTCNTPGSGLAARIRARFPDARIIDNTIPKGFAANHNVVLQTSIARYVWLLNDDLVLLPHAVERTTAFLDRPENAKVAVVSPRLLNPDGSLQPSTYSFPSMPQILVAHSGLRETPLVDSLLRRLAPVLRPREGSSRYWAHDRTIEVDTLRGACVALRMSAVREVGPMSEVAVVGAEEPEWHRRFKQFGWKVVYLFEATVIHYGSQTVADGSRNLYPEYLKGALHFFRSDRRAATYTVFCLSLLGLFQAKRAVAWIRRDDQGKDVARRYSEVAREALTRQ